MKYQIPTPPREIFMYPDGYQDTNLEGGVNEIPLRVLQENPQHCVIEAIEFNNGINVYYTDVPYPRKGFPFAEAIASINTVKRILIDSLSILRPWQLPFIKIENALKVFNRVAYTHISKYIIKPEFMTPFASEFQGIVFVFLHALGISIRESKKTAHIIGAIFEYDNAYRFRLQDLATETSIEDLTSSPILEIYRLIQIYEDREKYEAVKKKFNLVYLVLTFLLLVPKVRKAYIRAIKLSDFKRLKLDEIDSYWCNIREDYDYKGKPYEERIQGLTLPKVVELNIQ